MVERLWFTRKYGLSVPVRWEGWVSLVVFFLLLLAAAYTNGVFEGALKTLDGGLSFFLDGVILLLLFHILFRGMPPDDRRKSWWFRWR